jgi:hypothetical protein
LQRQHKSIDGNVCILGGTASILPLRRHSLAALGNRAVSLAPFSNPLIFPHWCMILDSTCTACLIGRRLPRFLVRNLLSCMWNPTSCNTHSSPCRNVTNAITCGCRLALHWAPLPPYPALDRVTAGDHHRGPAPCPMRTAHCQPPHVHISTPQHTFALFLTLCCPSSSLHMVCASACLGALGSLHLLSILTIHSVCCTRP